MSTLFRAPPHAVQASSSVNFQEGAFSFQNPFWSPKFVFFLSFVGGRVRMPTVILT